MEPTVIIHDEESWAAFEGLHPLTFDESVFDGIFDGPESCRPLDGALGCIFHIFIPTEIMAALRIRAEHAGIVGHRS